MMSTGSAAEQHPDRARRSRLFVGGLPAAAAAGLVSATIWRPSMWADETATWSAATRSWSQLGRLLHHQDAVFAVYYAAMHIWTALAGTSALALRAPSAMAAVATVFATGRLAQKRYGAVAGVAAGLSLALNPFFMFYAIDARPYAVAAMLGVLSTDALLTDNGRQRWSSYAALTAVGVLAHLYFVLFVLAQIIGMACTDRPRARRAVLAAAPALLAASALGAVGWTQRHQINWLPHTRPADLLLWWRHLTGTGVAGAIVAVLSLVGLAALRAHRRDLAVIGVGLALPSLLLVAVSQWWPLYDRRYVVESAPLIAVTAGCGVVALIERTQRVCWTRPIRAITGAVAAGIVAIAGAVTWMALDKAYFHENLAAAADELREIPANSAVAFVPGEARGALYYYLDSDQDGDLPLRDITAPPHTGPVTSANFSGSTDPFDVALHDAGRANHLVIVDLGAPTANVDHSLLTASFAPCGSERFGQMSLLYFCRR
jgi:uncharacterized membrane protein